jgi:MFS family permease
MQSNILQNVRFNFAVNVVDGAFFGLGLGFASSAAVIPLFVATLTDDTALIGFVAALHMIGWYLPQMLTAKYVAGLRRYKPLVLLMTMQERFPFFALAVVALLAPQMDKALALGLALFFLAWHSFGGGLTGTAWQTMIGKIMPANLRGTFWGVQAALASLLLSGGAIAAGFILDTLEGPLDFALCFLLTGVAMMISLAFLAMTREPASEAVNHEEQPRVSWRSFIGILKQDGNFRWFLIARSLSQLAWMGVSFYTIYATRHLGMDEQTAGLMVGVMALTQTVGNFLLGWIGDRWGHRKVFGFGAALIVMSALIAMFAPDQHWFYVVFGLAGVANATLWATAMALTIQFGTDREKPLYIGFTNTFIALPAIAAPIVGGWLADFASFQITFLVSVVSGLLMAGVLLFVMRDPHPTVQKAVEATLEPAPADLAA